MSLDARIINLFIEEPSPTDRGKNKKIKRIRGGPSVGGTPMFFLLKFIIIHAHNTYV